MDADHLRRRHLRLAGIAAALSLPAVAWAATDSAGVGVTHLGMSALLVWGVKVLDEMRRGIVETVTMQRAILDYLKKTTQERPKAGGV